METAFLSIMTRGVGGAGLPVTCITKQHFYRA
jgi:hypothetical protein